MLRWSKKIRTSPRFIPQKTQLIHNFCQIHPHACSFWLTQHGSVATTGIPYCLPLVQRSFEGWATSTPWTFFMGIGWFGCVYVCHIFKHMLYPRKLTVLTWKWMVGILVSFWDGLFSGAMLVLGSVTSLVLGWQRLDWRFMAFADMLDQMSSWNSHDQNEHQHEPY